MDWEWNEKISYILLFWKIYFQNIIRIIEG